MDKILKYKTILSEYLQTIVREWSNNPDEEVQVVCDQVGRHFLVLYYGWSAQGHLHSVPIHIEIKDDKVWIQENLTEVDLDDDLVAQGIPKEDIVLGVIPPEYRRYSGFAAA
jgi:hypothetical protein